MRVGDFGVELIPIRDGDVREVDSGHVLAKHGTVYAIRLRNFGPLRCLAEVRIDDRPVTDHGLVIDAYCVVTLERPVDAAANGRFTVIAEGDERVFGPDGGRDNDALGSIEVRFRRELPRASSRYSTFVSDDGSHPIPISPLRNSPRDNPLDPSRIPMLPGRPMAPPGWTPPSFRAMRDGAADAAADAADDMPFGFDLREPTAPYSNSIERAAGTGLTGHSSQAFRFVTIGDLEQEATVIHLRLVIGADEAFDAPRPLPAADHAPARPAARP